jgi:hypothetical protein
MAPGTRCRTGTIIPAALPVKRAKTLFNRICQAAPKGHATIEGDQEIIRQGLAKVFRGEMSFPMEVRGFPFDPQILANQHEIQTKLVRWLNGDGEVKVSIANPSLSSTTARRS